jgi:transmembrane sensor
MSRKHSQDDAVRERAAEFIVEDDGASAARDARQQHWLSESPKHLEERLRMGALWEVLGDPELAQELYEPSSRRRLARVRRVALAATAAVLIGVALSTWWLATRPEIYRTEVGEVRSFQFEDRSVVFLNAASELSVRYTDDSRLIELRSGEAAFDVARDESRPFVVETGTSRVVVLGTEFVVRRTSDRIAVTVIEGHVMVESTKGLVAPPESDQPQEVIEPDRPVPAPQSDPTHMVQLEARQKLTLDASGAAQITTIDPDDEPAAWRQRRLVFSSERLEDVAAEFNRFNVDAIQIVGPHLRDLRIGGVFDANDPESLMVFLKGLDGVTVRTAGDGTLIVSRSK